MNQNKWFKSKPCGEYKKGKITIGDHQSQIWETLVGGEMSGMCINDIAEWINVDNVYRRIVSHSVRVVGANSTATLRESNMGFVLEK